METIDQATMHHSPEEVEAAFRAAPAILREVRDLGIDGAYFELYEDASGMLGVPKGTTVDRDVAERVHGLVFSNRLSAIPGKPGIEFCCGLVQAARERGLLPREPLSGDGVKLQHPPARRGRVPWRSTLLLGAACLLAGVTGAMRGDAHGARSVADQCATVGSFVVDDTHYRCRVTGG